MLWYLYSEWKRNSMLLFIICRWITMQEIYCVDVIISISVLYARLCHLFSNRFHCVLFSMLYMFTYSFVYDVCIDYHYYYYWYLFRFKCSVVDGLQLSFLTIWFHACFGSVFSHTDIPQNDIYLYLFYMYVTHIMFQFNFNVFVCNLVKS